MVVWNQHIMKITNKLLKDSNYIFDIYFMKSLRKPWYLLTFLVAQIPESQSQWVSSS